VPAERIASGAGLAVSEVDEFLRRSTAELDDAGRRSTRSPQQSPPMAKPVRRAAPEAQACGAAV
jgi:hypothetical protein